MIDLVLAQQIVNHMRCKLTALISDQFSKVPKLIKYIFH